MGRLQKIVRNATRFAALPFAVSQQTKERLRDDADAWIGRRRKPRRHTPSDDGRYLDIGAGVIRHEGFVSLDFFHMGGDISADLRYPLPIDDESFDGVLSEHALEHLPYATVDLVLAEMHRVLRPGGVVRLVVPDVGLFAQRYVDDDKAWFERWERAVLGPRERHMRSPIEAISFVTQEYGHQSCWDATLMAQRMEAVGFVDVQQVDHGSGADPKLLVDNPVEARTMLSLYMEGRRASE